MRKGSKQPRIIDEFTHLGSKRAYYYRRKKRGLPPRKEYSKIRWHSFSAEKKRELWVYSQYKLTYRQYLEKLEQQKYKCEICKKEIKPLGKLSEIACVDHNHLTKQTRDLLCTNCNSMLGKVRESRELLQYLINYLDKWSNV